MYNKNYTCTCIYYVPLHISDSTSLATAREAADIAKFRLIPRIIDKEGHTPEEEQLQSLDWEIFMWLVVFSKYVNIHV